MHLASAEFSLHFCGVNRRLYDASCSQHIFVIRCNPDCRDAVLRAISCFSQLRKVLPYSRSPHQRVHPRTPYVPFSIATLVCREDSSLTRLCLRCNLTTRLHGQFVWRRKVFLRSFAAVPSGKESSKDCLLLLRSPNCDRQWWCFVSSIESGTP